MTSSRNHKLQPRHIPLEVLVVGLSRTGTTSILLALLRLGYPSVYDYNSLSKHPGDIPKWINFMRQKFELKNHISTAEWDDLLGSESAVCDSPCNIFTPELIAAYPDAKVILTVRNDVDTWYISFLQTIWVYLEHRFYPSTLFGRLVAWTLPNDGHDKLQRLINKYTPVGNFPNVGKQWYEEHNAMVRKIVPSENLLVYKVEDGWQPLCAFLEKKIPEVPFPRVNDKQNFQRQLIRVIQGQRAQAATHLRRALVFLAGIAISVAVCLWYIKA